MKVISGVTVISAAFGILMLLSGNARADDKKIAIGGVHMPSMEMIEEAKAALAKTLETDPAIKVVRVKKDDYKSAGVTHVLDFTYSSNKEIFSLKVEPLGSAELVHEIKFAKNASMDTLMAEVRKTLRSFRIYNQMEGKITVYVKAFAADGQVLYTRPVQKDIGKLLTAAYELVVAEEEWKFSQDELKKMLAGDKAALEAFRAVAKTDVAVLGIIIVPPKGGTATVQIKAIQFDKGKVLAQTTLDMPVDSDPNLVMGNLMRETAEKCGREVAKGLGIPQ